MDERNKCVWVNVRATNTRILDAAVVLALRRRRR